MQTEINFESKDRKFEVKVTKFNQIYDTTTTGSLEYINGGQVDVNKCPPITLEVYKQVLRMIKEVMPDYLTKIIADDREFNLDEFEELYLDIPSLGIKVFQELKDFNIVIDELERAEGKDEI